MKKPDVLIKNATIVTMDENRSEIPSGFIAVKDGNIQSIGNQKDCPFESAYKVIDAGGKVVLPGFINAHTHQGDILFRGGLSDDRVLYDWLFNVVIPGAAAYSHDDVKTSASLYCVESIRAGITTFVDMEESSFDRWDMVIENTIPTYEKFGVRVISPCSFYDVMPEDLNEYVDAVMESKGPQNRFPYEPIETTDEAMGRIEGFIKRYHGRADGRIQIWPAPCVAIMCSRKGLLKAKELAHKYGVMVSSHIAESKFDRYQAGVSSVEYLATIGFLGPDVLAAHCVHIDTNDIRILSRLGVKVANNASSNMYLGSGIAPVVEMQTAGVVVGIGTDDGCTNNTVNMLSDLKTVALAQKAKYQNSVVITAEKVLEMATIDGARAVGMDKEIGSLEEGKKADIIMVDMSAPHMVPRHNVASVLVYQALGTEVDTVLVDGKILMQDRKLTMLTREAEENIIASAQTASEAIADRVGFQNVKDRRWNSYKAV